MTAVLKPCGLSKIHHKEVAPLEKCAHGRPLSEASQEALWSRWVAAPALGKDGPLTKTNEGFAIDKPVIKSLSHAIGPALYEVFGIHVQVHIFRRYDWSPAG